MPILEKQLQIVHVTVLYTPHSWNSSATFNFDITYKKPLFVSKLKGKIPRAPQWDEKLFVKRLEKESLFVKIEKFNRLRLEGKKIKSETGEVLPKLPQKFFYCYHIHQLIFFGAIKLKVDSLYLESALNRQISGFFGMSAFIPSLFAKEAVFPVERNFVVGILYMHSLLFTICRSSTLFEL